MDVSKVYVWVRYETSFIHPPTRGATKLIFLIFVVWLVSIHAPTRGATSFNGTHQLFNRFQSTHLQEVRPGASILAYVAYQFQSTHLQEVRLSASWRQSIMRLFQSTHLQEVRHTGYSVVCYNN